MTRSRTESRVGMAPYLAPTWSALGDGIADNGVLALAVYDDGQGGGPALFAGGSFTVGPDSGDGFMGEVDLFWSGEGLGAPRTSFRQSAPIRCEVWCGWTC